MTVSGGRRLVCGGKNGAVVEGGGERDGVIKERRRKGEVLKEEESEVRAVGPAQGVMNGVKGGCVGG